MEVVVSQLSLGNGFRALCANLMLICALDDTPAPATQDTERSEEPVAKRRRLHEEYSTDSVVDIAAVVEQQQHVQQIAVNAMAAADKALVRSLSCASISANSQLLIRTDWNNNTERVR